MCVGGIGIENCDNGKYVRTYTQKLIMFGSLLLLV